MRRPKKYTKEFLEPFVKQSISMSGLLKMLGLKAAGGNYKHIKMYINYYNIDTGHFKGQSWAKGQTMETNEAIKKVAIKTAYSFEEVFCENSILSSTSSLKKKFLRLGICKYECSICGQQPFWWNKLLVLQLDHKNGNHSDNRIENLRFLCPNCHTQTETYSNKRNKKPRKVLPNATERQDNFYKTGNYKDGLSTRSKIGDVCSCGINYKTQRSNKCKACESKDRLNKNQKICWPALDILIQQIEKYSYLKVSKDINISDTAIRHHLKARGIDPKTLKPINNDPLCPTATDGLKG